MSSATPNTVELICETVASWEGVETAPHRYDAMEFRLGRRELGHLHRDGVADLPFPRRVRDELIAAHRAGPHLYLPTSGWVTASVNDPNGADGILDLFALSYRRATRAAEKRAKAASA